MLKVLPRPFLEFNARNWSFKVCLFWSYYSMNIGLMDLYNDDNDFNVNDYIFRILKIDLYLFNKKITVWITRRLTKMVM